MLASAPDQLISSNTPELLVTPEEPSLPIDAEPIRVITTGQSNDDAGLDAMMPMEQSIGGGDDAGRFFLLPLPPGLHPESPEMFGFFTYEIRVGHYRYTDTTAQHVKGEAVWTTAQGRYGRPLRVPGIQHPAPTLTCTVNRDERKLYVSAPYAVAVHNGRNVTATPPRTEIWALLYAQVKQADNKAFRNILLDDRLMSANLRVEHDPAIQRSKKYTAAERHTLNRAVARTIADRFDSTISEMVRLADETTVNEDATKFGTTIWSNADVARLLGQFGLLPDSPLSVLCVEILPHITNVQEHMSALHQPEVRSKARAMVNTFPSDIELAYGLAARSKIGEAVTFSEDRPLSRQLGQDRILRTSPLFLEMVRLADETTVNEDATKFGMTIWSNADVARLLGQFGLLPDSPLSVMCVEMMPHITNVQEHMSALHQPEVRSKARAMVNTFPSDIALAYGLAGRSKIGEAVTFSEDRPLSRQLGHHGSCERRR